MVRFLIERPIAIIVSFFALLLLGIVAHFKLPVSLLPDIDIPRILVKIDAEGMSAHETEQRVTAPIRTGLLQLKGLQEIESSSSDGRATIELLFDRSEDIGMAFIQVNERIDMAMSGMPKDFERPLVAKASISDIPVFRINVFPKINQGEASMTEVSTFAREVIRRRIEQIPEVAMVDITGYTSAQVELQPKTGYLESIGLTNKTLIQAFLENNISLGNILVSDGIFRYYLRFTAELQDLNAIRRIPLYIDGRIFKLSDLADVTQVQSEAKGYYHSNDIQAVNLMVIKQSAARINDLRQSFDLLLDQMRDDYPDIEFEITQDQSALLDFSIGNLQQDLFLGGILAFVFMLVFIRKLKMALLIGITIPLSLVISQLGFFLFDVSINVISLGGLILGLTMIIDSSIVVMDTISAHQNDGKNVEDASVVGTNEIIRPLITSVLTNCAVFIPLIFLGGLAGAIFYDQALSIVIGVVSSLAVAILALPPLFVLLHRNKTGKPGKLLEIPVLVNVTTWYDRCLKWCFRFPIIVALVVLFVAVSGIFLFNSIEKSRLPTITRYDFEIHIDWNEHIDAKESAQRAIEFANQIRQQSEVINIWSGEQQYLLPLMDEMTPSHSLLYVKTSQSNPISFLSATINKIIQQKYPSAVVDFSPSKNAFDEVFFDDKAPIVLKITDAKQNVMPALDSLSILINELTQALPNARIKPITQSQKIDLKVDYSKAMIYGINPDDIVDKITNTFQQQKIADYPSAHQQIPIVLHTPKTESIINLLRENFVTNKESDQIPLSAIVSFSKSYDYSRVHGGKSEEFYPVEIHSLTPEKDLRILHRILDDYADHMDVVYDGAYFDNQKLIGEMSVVLIVSVLLLYFILAAQFESLIQPLFILVELPIAISGALFFLYLGNSSLNLMSMIGIIVMSGLIINDSILKIDAINQLRNQGYPLMQAIFEGGHRRLRSIVMISLTSIGALFPTLLMNDLGSELQKPLTLSLMGGMIIGLFVSLFFVPIVYWIVYKTKEK